MKARHFEVPAPHFLLPETAPPRFHERVPPVQRRKAIVRDALRKEAVAKIRAAGAHAMIVAHTTPEPEPFRSPWIITPSKTQRERRWDRMGWPVPPMQAALTIQTTTNTASKVVDSGVDLLICWIAYDNAAGCSVTAGTVVWNTTETMTSAGAAATSTNGGQFYYIEAFYLKMPTSGTHNITATVAGTVRDSYFNVLGFTGADQTTPIRAGSYTAPTGAATTLSVSVPNSSGDITIGVYKGGGNGVQTVTGTSDGINGAGTTGAGSDHIAGTGSNNVHTMTSASAPAAATLGFAVAVAGAAGQPGGRRGYNPRNNQGVQLRPTSIGRDGTEVIMRRRSTIVVPELPASMRRAA